MADVVLNAPGTTNNPYNPSGFLTGLGGLGIFIASTATGLNSGTNGDFAEVAHNATYGSTITCTATIASGGASNGDEIWLGPIVRSGGNIGGGFGIAVGAFGVTIGWWTGASNLGTFTPISSTLSITRADSDIWSMTSVISGGTATISALQNGGALTFTGTITNTHFTAEASLAAGFAFNPQDNNSLFISQFTGTGVSGAPVSTLMGGISL